MGRLENNEKILECIERIVKLFKYDTLTLIDCVLEDDVEDPHFSANTTLKRIEDIALFEQDYKLNRSNDAKEWLYSNGYSKEDVCLFFEKVENEKKRYR